MSEKRNLKNGKGSQSGAKMEPKSIQKTDKGAEGAERSPKGRQKGMKSSM